MGLFRIVQTLDFDCVDDDLLDCLDLTLGYVDEEFFAQEFCNKFSCCSYEPVPVTKYPLQLRGGMVSDVEDVGLLRVPYKKYE